jgi:hypothetical protein
MFLLSGSWKCEHVERFDLTALSPSAPTFAMTAVGHSRRGRASSKSGHVRHAAEAEVICGCSDMPVRVDSDALNVISSYQPIER